MDHIDHALKSERPLVPSSGFEARVMDAVREAARSRPRPFPWMRFALGIFACVAGAATCVFALSLVNLTGIRSHLSQIAPELGYALAAAGASYLVTAFPRLLDLRS
jgi:hypothetical protein